MPIPPHILNPPEFQQLPIADLILLFSPRTQALALAMLEHPEEDDRRIRRFLAIPRNTFLRWRRTVKGFQTFLDRSASERSSALIQLARYKLLKAVPAITERMVLRAVSETAKDSQRAGERILETVGVLKDQQPTIKVEDRRIDLLALAIMQRNAERPRLQEATEAVYKELPEGHSVADST